MKGFAEGGYVRGTGCRPSGVVTPSEAFFSADELVRAFGPPPLYSAEPGNFVQLRSGGPKMIVSSTDGVAPEGTASCTRENDDGTLHTREFALVMLTAWPAAGE